MYCGRKGKMIWAGLVLAGLASAFAATEQVIVSIAPTWDSPTGKLQCFERDGNRWRAVGGIVPVLYGAKGLAWGKGIHGQNETGLHKVEKDKRAPAGVFRIGKIYTFDRTLPAGANYPFFTVTENCAWPDDPAHPYYNRHVTVDSANKPEWFESQKMRHNDPPHRWLVEIRHNSDPPVPGAGSAIFFHIRRGPDRASAGCTVMAEKDIVNIIRWLRASGKPRYALLPREEYGKRWKQWNLPPPETAARLLKK